ncbi:YbgF trimerization domain-containing protein, partial [Rhodanobacter sp. FW510-R10]|uniref:YbgF trimerization domain-containing protein n=2 Tax=Rhodanobacter TaxID=75309 RepID=UPI000B2DB515
MAGAVASAMLFAFPAFAQDSRLSLADRVARLEQQAQNKDQSGTGMVNQMQQLQAQVQQLQGQIEELQHQLQTLEDKNKAQYTDLDARLGRVESAGAAATAGGNPPAPAAGKPAAAAGNAAAAG